MARRKRKDYEALWDIFTRQIDMSKVADKEDLKQSLEGWLNPNLKGRTRENVADKLSDRFAERIVEEHMKIAEGAAKNYKKETPAKKNIGSKAEAIEAALLRAMKEPAENRRTRVAKFYGTLSGLMRRSGHRGGFTKAERAYIKELARRYL